MGIGINKSSPKECGFYTNLSSFPVTGSTNILYVDKSTGLTYIWNGSAYYVLPKFTTKTANYTVTEEDEIIEVDSTINTVAITLPTAISSGKRFIICWIAGANAVTITSANQLVDIDGTLKNTVTIVNLQDTYSYFKGSLRWQLF